MARRSRRSLDAPDLGIIQGAFDFLSLLEEDPEPIFDQTTPVLHHEQDAPHDIDASRETPRSNGSELAGTEPRGNALSSVTADSGADSSSARPDQPVRLDSTSGTGTGERTDMEHSGVHEPDADVLDPANSGSLLQRGLDPVHDTVHADVVASERGTAPLRGRGQTQGALGDVQGTLDMGGTRTTRSAKPDSGTDGAGITGEGVGKTRQPSAVGSGTSGTSRAARAGGLDLDRGTERGTEREDRSRLGSPAGALKFEPSGEVLVPSSARARAHANIAAIRLLRDLEESERWPTPEEQSTLAKFSSWGAVPQIFEVWREDWANEQKELAEVLSADELSAASATTLNAHYTDPAVVSAMWGALERAGFSSGTVLEPGSGSGNFIGAAPSGARMIGVELDPISARIAHYLYPDAHIRNQGFERTQLGGQVDAVMGNVPFGSFSLYDPIDNPQDLSIHNHFIVKSLKATAPGGYVMVLTSSFTMDAVHPKARREMAKYGELLGAVRLPTGAMSRVAGTDAMTDIVVFRRYEDSKRYMTLSRENRLGWLNTDEVALPHDDGSTATTNINSYWTENPDNVLGTLALGTGQYNANTLSVRSESARDSHALGQAVAERLNAIIDANGSTTRFAPKQTVEITASDIAPGLVTPATTVGELVGQLRLEGATPQVYNGKEWATASGNTASRKELASLLSVRDAAREVLDAQRVGAHEDLRQQKRDALIRAYDAYADQYGPINRYERVFKPLTKAALDKKVREQRVEWENAQRAADGPEANLEPSDELLTQWLDTANLSTRVIKRYPHLTLMREDPEFALLLSLENFDDDTHTARKTDIFYTDIVSQLPQRTQATSAGEAAAISLDETREVRVERVAELLNVSVDDAMEQLSEVAFREPGSDKWVIAPQYLSGDVRAKLREALAAHEIDPVYGSNISALQGLVPEDVHFEEISIRAGARYIPTEFYEQFSEDILKASVTFTDNASDGRWVLKGPSASSLDGLVRHEYGTDARSPLDMLDSLMNNDPIIVSKTVTDEHGNTRSVRDVEATALANETMERLNQSFVQWLENDSGRRQFIEERYNNTFNSYVAPDYTSLSEHMALPGLNPRYTPHPYQRAAVAQIVHEPAVLLDHVVGAGKTGTMIMGAMELRRQGIARKPWVVVPNHLVEQISAEWKAWYPDARILALGTELNPKQRQSAIMKSATGDWDAVIVPASTFGLIGLDKNRTAQWLQEDIALLRAQLMDEGANPESRTFVKKLETKIKNMETRYEKIMDSLDEGYTFEQSGCDYLFVDEAHNFKNLARESRHSELAHNGSRRAADLDYKMRALRETKIETMQRAGHDVSSYIPAVATFATGTPVANSLAEMWVMQRYLRPDLLEAAGLPTINSWAGQFTESQTKLELGPDGTSWRMRPRISKFTNLPELLRITEQFASTVTREQIPVALPELIGGQRGLLSREPSEHVVEHVQQLAYRANNLPKDPSEDNLLKITHEGRMIAIDPRTLGMEPDPDGGRVYALADEVMRIHELTRDTTYRDAHGEIEPLPGGLQIVFLDRSTPKANGEFSVYQEIKTELVARGLRPDQVAFIHDAADDLAREDLFARCRSGQVSVLVGSTEKMGTGTNVQKRATALHHFDVPWRPADLEQREGRIIRQGNQNKQVVVNQYVTEGTYDAVMWQQVARKASFIAQTKSKSSARTLAAESDDMTISAAAASAIATGDPRIIERAELIHKIDSLSSLERGHQQKQASVRAQIRVNRETLAGYHKAIDGSRIAAETYRPTAGDAFAMTIGERTIYDRIDAGHALKAAIAASKLTTPPRVIIGNIEMKIGVLRADRTSFVAPVLNPDAGVAVELEGDPMGAVRRVENCAEKLASALPKIEKRIEELTSWLDQMGSIDDKGFTQKEELDALRARLEELDAELEMTQNPDQQVAEAIRYVSEDESMRLWGKKVAQGKPRVGDVIELSGTSGRWKVIDIADTRRLEIQRQGDGVGEIQTVRSALAKIIGRELASLTEVEQNILNYEMPVIAATEHPVTVGAGTDVLVYATPVSEVYGRPHQQTGEAALIRGTLVNNALWGQIEKAHVIDRAVIATLDTSEGRVTVALTPTTPSSVSLYMAEVKDPALADTISATKLRAGDMLIVTSVSRGTLSLFLLVLWFTRGTLPSRTAALRPWAHYVKYVLERRISRAFQTLLMSIGSVWGKLRQTLVQWTCARETSSCRRHWVLRVR